ncbi:MAG: hypothetical protein HYT94_00020 [Parcubacteria group bacterium]|nr:hypothetical protein [Parcubacteria group bacterium]
MKNFSFTKSELILAGFFGLATIVANHANILWAIGGGAATFFGLLVLQKLPVRYGMVTTAVMVLAIALGVFSNDHVISLDEAKAAATQAMGNTTPVEDTVVGVDPGTVVP